MALTGAQIASVVLFLVSGAVGCYMAKMIKEYCSCVRAGRGNRESGGVVRSGGSGVVEATRRMEEGRVERRKVVHIQHDIVVTRQVVAQLPRQEIEIQHQKTPYGIQIRDFACPPPVFPAPPATPPAERRYVFQQFDGSTAPVAPVTPAPSLVTGRFARFKSFITPPPRAVMRA